MEELLAHDMLQMHMTFKQALAHKQLCHLSSLFFFLLILMALLKDFGFLHLREVISILKAAVKWVIISALLECSGVLSILRCFQIVYRKFFFSSSKDGSISVKSITLPEVQLGWQWQQQQLLVEESYEINFCALISSYGVGGKNLETAKF